MLEYKLANSYYNKILELNPNDEFAERRSELSFQKFSQDCRSIFTKAEYFFKEKEYEKAKPLYEQVVAQECTNNLAIATDRINTITALNRARQDHSRVFSYEYRIDVPIGFSYGSYRMHRVGGFFQMDMNKTVFDAIRGDCKYGDTKFPELNMAFGWTVKIANPVWIHFGPGLTGKMYFGTYKKDCYPKKGYGETDLLDTQKMGTDLTSSKEIPETYEDGWKKANIALGISPVAGITVKYSYFALRLSYQYRWSIKSELEDFLGVSRLSVGVGLSF